MTTDVNGTVVGIEGTPVSATTPTTGQVMQFNGTECAPANFPTTQSQTFTSNGSWTCPTGVVMAILQGCGGGGGGAGAGSSGASYGNGGSGGSGQLTIIWVA